MKKFIATFIIVLLFLIFSYFIKSFDVNAQNSFELLNRVNIIANGIAVSDNLAYILSFEYVYIYNIYDPASPALVGSYYAPGCDFMAIDVVGNIAYPVDVYYRCDPYPNTIFILDVSNPQTPQKESTIQVGGPGAVQDIKVLDGYAYVTDAHGGLRIINVSDPTHPEEVATYVGNFYGMKIVGNLIYLPDVGTSKLLVLDITNRSQPQKVVEYNLPSIADYIDVDGNYAFLSSGIRMRIFDISNLSDIKEIGSFIPQPDPNYGEEPIGQVRVSNGFSFLANRRNGIVVADVSNPANPMEVGKYVAEGQTNRVYVYGDLVFLSNSDKGLYILRFSGLPSPAPTPFLDLPWNYEGKGLSFTDAALSINSYFDHEYPLLSTSLDEPFDSQNTITSYKGEFRVDRDYSSHDGYDYGRRSKAIRGEFQLAAAAGCATYHTSPTGGNMIFIDHHNGFQTRYYHLGSNDLITTDSSNCVEVETRQKIGLIGYTGNVIPRGEQGAHIHFMVIQDKNKDGDFEDNIPDGLVDPFGWQGNDPDPWPLYSFNYKEADRVGNKSYYLWMKKLDSGGGILASTGGSYQAGRLNISFPEGIVDENLNLKLESLSSESNSETQEFVGATYQVTARNSLGNIVTDLLNFFSIGINFSPIDLGRYLPGSLKIYSSSDMANWQEEETLVDLDTKTATTNVNHLSYFVLVGERADLTPPITTHSLIGDVGDVNWFRSNVSLSLNSSDEGSGVDYVLYKVGDEDWKEYSNPLNFSNEGSYKVDYYSVDKDENIEEIKSVEFGMDKTLPEIKIQFNPNTKKVDFANVDSSDETERTLENLSDGKEKVALTDKAGNRTSLIYKKVSFGTSILYYLKSLQYNLQPEVSLDNTSYYVGYILDKTGKIKVLGQSWVGKNILVGVAYESKNNTSYILYKETGKDLVQTKVLGIALLSIKTDNANLKVEY